MKNIGRIYTAAFNACRIRTRPKTLPRTFFAVMAKREENNIDNLPAYLFTATKNKVYN